MHLRRVSNGKCKDGNTFTDHDQLFRQILSSYMDRCHARQVCYVTMLDLVSRAQHLHDELDQAAARRAFIRSWSCCTAPHLVSHGC